MAENDCNPIPMGEWIQQDYPKNCRPCIVAPVVRWYRDHLQEKGQKEFVQKIESLAETADVLTICQELDKIKESVDNPTRERLRVFDCAVQNYTNTPSEQVETTTKEADSG